MIEQVGDTVKLNVLAVQKAFSMTAAVKTDEEIQIARPVPKRVCITADSVRIQVIAYSEAVRKIGFTIISILAAISSAGMRSGV